MHAIEHPPGATASPPLSRQLSLAAKGLHAVVMDGQSARDVVATWPSALRPGASALLYNGLRHWGEAQALIGVLAQRPPHPHVRALLAVALGVLLTPDRLGYQPFTVVDQTVAALRRDKRFASQAGFVNACLRRFLREQEALRSRVGDHLEARWNHPLWWIERVRCDHPAAWQQVLSANNQRAPLTLRVNTARIARDAYLAQLTAQGIAAHAVLAQGVVLAQPRDVRALPGYAQGWFSVQDAAAQRAAPWLLGERADALNGPDDGPLLVLDACAAPGGKTAHLVEVANAGGVPIQVVAMDVDAARCARIEENLARLGHAPSVQVVVADASQPDQWPDSLRQRRPFDAILLDAPCSASGIVRRHPDIRWLRRPGDIDALMRTQQELLARLWPLLREGGRLLYCTCSVFQDEGQGQVQGFLARHDDARLVGPMVQLLPSGAETDAGAGAMEQPAMQGAGDQHDGFFFGLLEKAMAC